MQFNYLQIDAVNEITVRVLIVEDSVEQALAIGNIIIGYTSKLDGIKDIFRNEIQVTYQVIVNGSVIEMETAEGINRINEAAFRQNFRGTFDYINSMSYCILNPDGFDIVLCDYELSSKKGNEFLEEVYAKEIAKDKRYFKILHSVKGDKQQYQFSGYIDGIFESKSSDTLIENILLPFENNIIIPILFGNPEEHPLNYSPTHNTRYAIKDAGDFFYDKYHYNRIFCVYSAEKNRYFQPIILDENYSVKTGELSKNPIGELSPHHFVSFGQSLYVNRLWLSNHDVMNGKFHFIRPGTDLYTFKLQEHISVDTKKFSYWLAKLINFMKAKEVPATFNFKSLNAYFKPY